MAMIIFKEKILFYHFLGAIFIIAGIIVDDLSGSPDKDEVRIICCPLTASFTG